MLDEIRTALRIKHNKLDGDIQHNIDSCLDDMANHGINVTDNMDDTLISKAAELYCKWMYDFNGKGEQFRINYEQFRDGLSLSGKYKE